MAHLNVNLENIQNNIGQILEETNALGLNLVGVVKPCQEFHPVVRAYDESGVACLGVSRADAARRLKAVTRKPLMLTCIPRPDIARDVVRYCDYSLNSELTTIRALAEQTEITGRRHNVILMVEVGDLREGVLPDDLLESAARIYGLRDMGLHFAGIGANFGCVNGVLPSTENIALIEYLVGRMEREIGLTPQIVSLGGSVILEWMRKHKLPACVNQIRVGEPILLGGLSGSTSRYKSLHQDALEFEATIVEIKRKPSYPVGEKSADAFGVSHQREDLGIRMRALLDFGVVDTDPESLVLLDPGLQLVASNSDYTVIDVTECETAYKVGDVMRFRLTYKSMLQCFTNVRLRKNLVRAACSAEGSPVLDHAAARGVQTIAVDSVTTP